MNIIGKAYEFKIDLLNRIKKSKLFWYLLLTIVMGLVVSGGDILNCIYKSAKSQYFQQMVLKYMDYCSIIKIIIPNGHIRWGIFGITILVLLLKIFVDIFYKEQGTLYILEHSSMGKTQYKIKNKLVKFNNINIEQIDLTEDMNRINGDYRNISYVISKQDSLVEKFKSSINNKDEFGYMGIAHTPLILRAGNKIGDETKFTIFHKKRNVDYFEELNEDDIFTPLKIEKKVIKGSCKELILAISTTFEIKDNELNILQPGDKSIIKYKTDEFGFDVITSKKQVESYVNCILSEVRQIVKENEISKIHMVISSSVAFTFALGQALSNHYDPEIIIYHYEFKNPKKYPWGISLFEDYTNCVVVK